MELYSYFLINCVIVCGTLELLSNSIFRLVYTGDYFHIAVGLVLLAVEIVSLIVTGAKISHLENEENVNKPKEEFQ